MKTTASSRLRCLISARCAVFPLAIIAGVAAGLLATQSTALAQETGTLAALYSFGGIMTQAPEPGNLLQGNDGNFYGTTIQGYDAAGDGSIFQVTPAGVLTTIHVFDASEGSYSNSLIQGSDGNFYGATYTGGPNQNGTIFQLTPAGGFTVLYASGTGDSSLYAPSISFQGTDGNLYGTCISGTDDNLVIFRCSLTGNFSALCSFDGNNPANYNVRGLMQASDGNFYGTTNVDIDTDTSSEVYGTIFQLTPAGSLTILHTLSQTDGYDLLGQLVEGDDGNFYGITDRGGRGAGTVFQVTPAGDFDVLLAAPGPPETGLLKGNDGMFYAGVYTKFFQFSSEGAATDLCSFVDLYNVFASGRLVLASDGNIYGTTTSGGTNGDGFLFRLMVNPAFFTGQVAVGDGAYYLAFPDSQYFGYYSFLSDPSYLYHFDLGFEYVFDADDSLDGVFLYDFASGTFFYTSPTFPFPYLYDFSLNSVLYYYPDTTNPGHYTSNPRYFYDFATGQIITK